MTDEALRQVRADLRHVCEACTDSVDNDTLRRSSGILRRILVEGGLQQAWKAAGFAREPILTAASLDGLALPDSQFKFAVAGGARYDYGTLGAILMHSRPPGTVALPQPVAVGLRAYVEATCIICDGQPISRRVLIKYIANKLGGVHYDSTRPTKEPNYSVLDEAATWSMLGKKRGGVVVDPGKPSVYFEMLAIAQTLAASGDVQTFLDSERQQEDNPPMQPAGSACG